MSIAPLRLRILAASIDVALVLVGFIGLAGSVFGMGMLLPRLLGAKRRATGGPEEPATAEAGSGTAGAGGQPRTDEPAKGSRGARASRSIRGSEEGLATLARLVAGTGPGLAVATRNCVSPGYRRGGLRRVDARTGGPVRVSGVISGSCFDQLSQAVVAAVFGGATRARKARARELEGQLEALRSTYPSDPHALQRATTELYAEHRLSPWDGCGQLLAGHLIWSLAAVLTARGGRTVRDRLTGTAVIVVPK